MMKNTEYRIDKVIFNLVDDVTEICGGCGIPACGRESFLWHFSDEKRLAIMFDGTVMENALAHFLSSQRDPLDPSVYPKFIEEYCLEKGWAEWGVDGDFGVAISDLKIAIEMLIQSEPDDYCMKMLKGIQRFLLKLNPALKTIYITNT